MYIRYCTNVNKYSYKYEQDINVSTLLIRVLIFYYIYYIPGI
jgi:hypothetical protein